jgi:hypothetical protein
MQTHRRTRGAGGCIPPIIFWSGSKFVHVHESRADCTNVKIGQLTLYLKIGEEICYVFKIACKLFYIACELSLQVFVPNKDVMLYEQTRMIIFPREYELKYFQYDLNSELLG